MFLHGYSAEGDGEDAGHVEDLCSEIGQVRHGEHKQGFQHSGMVGEPETQQL